MTIGARYEYKGTELKGKTLGLIGLGRIGSLVARKATNGFDMKVIAYDEFLVKNEYAGFVTCASSMEEVLAKSDFVSLHVLQEDPIAQDHPFFELDNLIMTPHHAIITHEAMDLMGYHAAVGIDDVLNGRQSQWQERLVQTAVAEQV